MNVIITGASKGIGKAIAEIFASNGYNLFLCSRGEVSLYKVMEELQTRFPAITIKAKPADMSKKEEVIAFANWCLSFAVPDVVVNNAGTAMQKFHTNWHRLNHSLLLPPISHSF